MKKLYLSVLGMYIMILQSFSQGTPRDSSEFMPVPLHVDEVNLVTGYYKQDGNHSPVTGGIGTERVTDIANGIEIKFVAWGPNRLKYTLSTEFNIDHHSAASSAYVSKTGASRIGGTRIYPSVNWSVENEAKGRSFGLGAYYSSEYNYHSLGLNTQFSQKTKSNGEFEAKLSGYFDRVKMIYPSELIPGVSTSDDNGTVTYTTASGRTVVLGRGGNREDETTIPSKPRNTFTGSFSFSQVINSRLQAAVMLDLVGQSGYLGLPFHRVYFNNDSVQVEHLPSSRFKLPIGFRLNYFAGDRVILRSYYRFYTDNWGVMAHTASLEMPVKITPFFSVSPFYRYYKQTAAKYFAPYKEHSIQDDYYTSNYALSAFTSQFFGAGIRLAPPNGLLWKHLNALELRAGHYAQTTGLVANEVTLHLKFK